MRHLLCKLKGTYYLAVITMLALATGGNALLVVNKHTASGMLTKAITVTTAGTYYHEAMAPADGDLYSEIPGRSIPFDDIWVEDGACQSHAVTLQVTGGHTGYSLQSTANITTGAAKAQVRSGEIVSLCPNGNGG